MIYNIDTTKKEGNQMIEEFSGVCSDAMSTLLDVYQMKNWDMTWENFLAQFEEEILVTIERWKNEEIN